MYTRQEASLIRKKFWTLFGQYMRPVKNSEGESINWINYKTGIRGIFFRMDADQKSCSVAIEIRHEDTGLQQQYFNQLQQYRSLLTSEPDDDWNWALFTQDEHGQTISRISQSLTGVNVFHEPDWPAIISFLKPRLITLDNFWLQVKDQL